MELTESEGRMVLTGDYETIRLGVAGVNVDPMVQHFSWTVGSKQLMAMVTFLIKHLKMCAHVLSSAHGRGVSSSLTADYICPLGLVCPSCSKTH